MTFCKLLKALASWKLTCDHAGFLIWILKHDLNVQDWFFRYFRFTPGLLEEIRTRGEGCEAQSEAFTTAISWFRFGHIHKLTSRNRTLLADEAILSRATTMEAPSLFDIGCSDGIASLLLLEQGDRFSRIALADRFNLFYSKKWMGGRLFFNADGDGMTFKVGPLSFSIEGLGLKCGNDAERIETINPLLVVRGLASQIERFDLFNDVAPEPYSIIKCANILNSSYFPDDVIRCGVENLCRSLAESGFLIISQNNEKYVGGEAVFVLRKEFDGIRMVESVNNHDLACLFQGVEKCE